MVFSLFHLLSFHFPFGSAVAFEREQERKWHFAGGIAGCFVRTISEYKLYQTFSHSIWLLHNFSPKCALQIAFHICTDRKRWNTDHKCDCFSGQKWKLRFFILQFYISSECFCCFFLALLRVHCKRKKNNAEESNDGNVLKKNCKEMRTEPNWNIDAWCLFMTMIAAVANVLLSMPNWTTWALRRWTNFLECWFFAVCCTHTHTKQTNEMKNRRLHFIGLIVWFYFMHESLELGHNNRFIKQKCV